MLLTLSPINPMKTLVFLFMLILPMASLAQNLYIKIDVTDTQYQQYAGTWKSPDNDGTYIKNFIFSANCHIPDFTCSDKATRSQILPLGSLSTYPNVKTVPQLATELANKDYIEVQYWLVQFQNIYVIQVLPATNQIEVSKVDKPRFVDDK